MLKAIQQRNRVQPAHPRIAAAEAREDWSDLINRVGFGGERLVITRSGKPVVAVVSIDDLSRLDALNTPKGGTTVSAREAKAPTKAAS